VAYDEAGLTCVTWGQLQPMTWNFVQVYSDECYGVTDDPSGLNPAMVKRSSILGFLSALELAKFRAPQKGEKA
jgi:hypothetical protein